MGRWDNQTEEQRLYGTIQRFLESGKIPISCVRCRFLGSYKPREGKWISVCPECLQESLTTQHLCDEYHKEFRRK